MVERKETNGQFKIVQPLKVCCGGKARDNCVKKKEKKKARKELNQSPFPALHILKRKAPVKTF